MAIWTVNDVKRLYDTVEHTTDVAMEAKSASVRCRKYSEMMFRFIMRNLPLKRKRKAMRRMIAAMKRTEGGRR